MPFLGRGMCFLCRSPGVEECFFLCRRMSFLGRGMSFLGRRMSLFGGRKFCLGRECVV